MPLYLTPADCLLATGMVVSGLSFWLMFRAAR
jgi:hypothetical protein